MFPLRCSLACISPAGKLNAVCDDAAAEAPPDKAGISKSGRQCSDPGHAQMPAQVMRRSQRQQQQQQQRQLRDKQLQAEKQHTVRIRTQSVAVVTPSSTHSSIQSTTCAMYSRSKSRHSSAQLQQPCSDENSTQQQQQQQRQKGIVGSNAVIRKGKSSPTAGIKKQTSPVGKGSAVALALGGRFPLRVRRNVEQPSMKGDLNAKFGRVCENRGLGDLASH